MQEVQVPPSDGGADVQDSASPDKVTKGEKKSSGWYVVLLVVVVVLVLVLGLVYYLVQSKYSEQAPARKTQTGSPDMAGLDEVETIRVEGELVASFPEFPVYSGAKIEYSYESTSSQPTGYEALWVSNAPVPTVMSWYIDTLTAEGWEIESLPDNRQDPTEQFLIASKGDNTVYLITEDEDKGYTEIFVEFPVALQD